MGTNYYCVHPDGTKLHMGKSSWGWTYCLRVHPKLDIDDLDDWVDYVQADPLRVIIDEYDDGIDWYDWLSTVLDRKWAINRISHVHTTRGNYYTESTEVTWTCSDNEFS